MKLVLQKLENENPEPNRQQKNICFVAYDLGDNEVTMYTAEGLEFTVGTASLEPKLDDESNKPFSEKILDAMPLTLECIVAGNTIFELC